MFWLVCIFFMLYHLLICYVWYPWSGSFDQFDSLDFSFLVTSAKLKLFICCYYTFSLRCWFSNALFLFFQFCSRTFVCTRTPGTPPRWRHWIFIPKKQTCFAPLMVLVRFDSGMLANIHVLIFPRSGFEFLFLVLSASSRELSDYSFKTLCLYPAISSNSVVQHKWDFSLELDNFWRQRQKIQSPSLMSRQIGRHLHCRCLMHLLTFSCLKKMYFNTKCWNLY